MTLLSCFIRRHFYLLALMLCLSPLAHAGAYEDFFNAIKTDNVESMTSLLNRGLDPNLIEEERGETGLMLALREGSTKIFKLLLNQPNIDLEVKARNGDNVLMIAAFKGNQGAVETLLNKGAAVNRSGWTALHYAAAIGNNEIAQMLMKKGADINAESPNKTTPMMMAARGGHILTVKLLLDGGADATLRNEAGLTAIDFANQFGFKDIAEGLTYRLKKAGKM
ncbi:MAG: ankyrin repeat domain-containing protein [Proteobacteria bacterium]|nr:ankyrin repeat domain-containing protein [Pseudomonadota bacterium]